MRQSLGEASLAQLHLPYLEGFAAGYVFICLLLNTLFLLRHSVEMASAIITAALLLVASLIGIVGSQSSSNSVIGTGSIISADPTGNAAWSSSSGRFSFGFYQEGSGFAIGIQFFPNTSFSTVIWTADRDQQPIPANATLTFGNEGLVLHLDQGDRTISNLYSGSLQFATASMLDSGNFVVYDLYGSMAWQTFDNPTDTLVAGQVLPIGKQLISSVSENNHSSGRFRLAMQRNGNAVLYPMNTPETDTNAYWYFGNYAGYGFMLNNSGSFSDSEQSSSQKLSVVHLARIEPDGYLRIFYTNQSGLMTVSERYPHEENKCSIKGVCGLNSYCNSTGNGEVDCLCLPGYVYMDPRRAFAGCQRNYTKESCGVGGTGTSNITYYNMWSLVNITWSDDSYSTFQVRSEGECSEACFRDCDCYAALFYSLSKRCSKQRHPFQYGKALIGRDQPTVAFFKVGPAEKPQKLSVQPVGIGSLRVLKTLPLVLSLLTTAACAVALDFLIFFMCRYRIERYRRLCESMERGLAEAMAPRSFSCKQLEEATDGYKEEIGEGSYGKVFKGILPPRDAGTPIAVKKLKNVRGKVEEKFRNEMKAIGRVHHRNLVRLLGFCHEGSDWILVYEYMSGGSLADLIFNSQANPPSWKQRVSIAMDVARGLCYLHEGCEVAIIHGDIKPENVLIGEDGSAKIGDLGLAKHLQPGKFVTYTHSRGTTRYKAPEWIYSDDAVSTKVDVVSFGILLLELIFLRKYTLCEEADGEYNLASWAYKCLDRQSKWQVPGSDVDAKQLEEIVKIALWCFPKSLDQRSSMYDVVMMLGRKKIVKFPPVPLVDWSDRAVL